MRHLPQLSNPVAEGAAVRREQRSGLQLRRTPYAGARSADLDVVEQALARMDPGSGAAAPLWALLVEVHLAADRLDAAQDAAERTACCARRSAGPYLAATAALARGRVCVATGSDPCECLQQAQAGFARAGMPMEAARARLALARALAADRPEVARAEAGAALDAFARLQAGRDADAAAALLASSASAPPSPGGRRRR